MAKVREGQSMLDLAVQEFGTIDNIFDIIDAAPELNLSLTSELVAGTQIELVTENVGDESIKDFYRRGVLITNNAAPQEGEALGGDYNNDYNNDYN